MTKNEKRLNEFFNLIYTEDEIVEKYFYITNPSRGKHCSEKALRRGYKNNRIGSMLRIYDPIAYQLTIKEYIL